MGVGMFGLGMVVGDGGVGGGVAGVGGFGVVGVVVCVRGWQCMRAGSISVLCGWLGSVNAGGT